MKCRYRLPEKLDAAPNVVDAVPLLLLSKGDDETVVGDTYRELFVDDPPPKGDCDVLDPLPNAVEPVTAENGL